MPDATVVVMVVAVAMIAVAMGWRCFWQSVGARFDGICDRATVCGWCVGSRTLLFAFSRICIERKRRPRPLARGRSFNVGAFVVVAAAAVVVQAMHGSDK